MRMFAPAKINLTLEVGYPYRATGRHPLQSVVMFADVGDWIELGTNKRGCPMWSKAVVVVE